MNLWKKLLTVLALACLVVNMIPGAMAVEPEARLYISTDYSELELQVAMANSLNSYDYTAESWEPLQTALDRGNRILKGVHGQTVVNETAQAIETAVAGLVKMDYSSLDTALADVYSELEKNLELYDVWSRLETAVEAARPLLVSGHQGAVDYAAEELRTLLAEMQEILRAGEEPEVVYQEVEVEVLPTEDYCNIPMHRTWPVLFVISAVLNVALIVVLTYVIMKKRQTMDNTPLVSYDIDDDIDY